jgi:hypothetical protein
MTISAELADGTRLEFEDGIDPKVMDAIVKRHIAQTRIDEAKATALDVAKSAAYAAPKAAAGFAGMPKDFASLSELAHNSLNQYLPEWMQSGANAVRNISQSPLLRLAERGVGSQDIRGAAEKVTGPWYEPQTLPGKFADTFTQVGLTGGRNLLTTPGKVAAMAGGAATGATAAGALTNDNPWAKLAGMLVGGGVPTAAMAYVGKPGQQLRQAFGNLTPEQIAAGRMMEANAKQMGVPLTGIESLDRGYELASTVGAHPAGYSKLRSFLLDRPAKVESAVNRGLIEPTGNTDIPTVNAARAQEAATNAIAGAEKSVTDETSPIYQAAQKDLVDKKEMAALVSRAKARAASDTTGILSPVVSEYIKRLTTSESTPAITGIPGKMGQGRWIPGTPDVPAQPASYALDIGNLDRARKYFRDIKELPPFAAEAIPKEAGTAIGGLNRELKDVMAKGSPRWDEARQLHQDLTQQRVDPLLSSGVGKLAGKGFDPAVYPAVQRAEEVLSNVKEVRPETIKTVYKSLNEQDAQAFPGIAKTWIENSFDRAMKDNVGGVPSTVGAKLARDVAGSPVQKQNFDEVLRGVAEARGVNPDEYVQGANVLLDVLRRTGKTPGQGSQTFGRSAAESELNKTFFGDLLSTISLNPGRVFGRRWSTNIGQKRFETLADALTAPNSVDTLVKMAKLEPSGLTAKYYAAMLLGLDKAAASSGE